MGRDAVRLRRAETRAAGHARRVGGMVPEKSCRLQGAAHRAVHRAAEDQYGKDSEIQAAGDGEGGVANTFVLASEAKQSKNTSAWFASELDCFVAALLAMTGPRLTASCPASPRG